MTKLLGVRVVSFVIVGLLVGAFLLTLGEGAQTRTLIAHFPRAVSVYEGTEVRILGVNVGRVTTVTPEGESVRVEIEYDDQYDVPADAQAVIVTPTLVADRFVQLTPVYSKGDEVMADGGDIPLPDTAVPVELDRIYASLRDLTHTLGPNGVNANGTLDNLLQAGRRGLEGQGARGNEMIRNLSEAATTFGDSSGDLFETVSRLAEFTSTLADNDQLVRAFIRDLAGVSSQLAGERVELQRVLGSVADAVGTVEGFVRNNREALVTDVEKLTRVLGTINSEKESIDTALNVAPVAINNLVLAFDTDSGSIGSRINTGENVLNLGDLLCTQLQQSDLPGAEKKLACKVFEILTEPLTKNAPPTFPPGPSDESSRTSQSSPETAPDGIDEAYLSDAPPTLATLLGGAA